MRLTLATLRGGVGLHLAQNAFPRSTNGMSRLVQFPPMALSGELGPPTKLR